MKHNPTRRTGRRGPLKKDATLVEQMDRKVSNKRGRALYRRRQQLIEPVFGQIKDARGFRSFMRRGKAAVDSEWKLIFGTHNLLKRYRRALAKPDTVPFSRLAVPVAGCRPGSGASPTLRGQQPSTRSPIVTALTAVAPVGPADISRVHATGSSGSSVRSRGRGAAGQGWRPPRRKQIAVLAGARLRSPRVHARIAWMREPRSSPPALHTRCAKYDHRPVLSACPLAPSPTDRELANAAQACAGTA